jgi:hypothetical protein
MGYILYLFIGIIGSLGIGHKNIIQKNRSLLLSAFIAFFAACTAYSVYLFLALSLGKKYITFSQLSATPYFLATPMPFLFLVTVLFARCIILAVAEIALLLCSTCTGLDYNTHVIKRLGFTIAGSALAGILLITMLPPLNAGLIGCVLGVILFCIQYLAYSIDTRIMSLTYINFYLIDYLFSVAETNTKALISIAVVAIFSIFFIMTIEKTSLPKLNERKKS